MKIEIIGIDREGFEIGSPHEVITIKEAKQHINDCMLDRDYWDEAAEVKGFWKTVSHVEIRKNGETHSEFFLKDYP